MPAYEFKCTKGHVYTEPFSFKEYDDLKLARDGDHCPMVEDGGGKPTLCLARSRVVTQATPFHQRIRDWSKD